MVADAFTATPKALRLAPPAKMLIKAIAFDAFPIFDPKPAFDLVHKFFPNHAADLSNEWRTRQPIELNTRMNPFRLS